MADKVTAELLALKSRLDNANPRYYGGSTRIDILPEDYGTLLALVGAAIAGKPAYTDAMNEKPAAEDNGLLDRYRQNLIEECAAVCDHWIGSKNLHEHLAATNIKRLILKLSTTGEPKR